jgi:hypothetical protein
MNRKNIILILVSLCIISFFFYYFNNNVTYKVCDNFDRKTTKNDLNEQKRLVMGKSNKSRFISFYISIRRKFIIFQLIVA